MNVRPFDPKRLKWEIYEPTYRVDIWVQKNAPPESEQRSIGWKHEAQFELTDVDDVSNAIEWATAKAHEAGAQEGIHRAVCALYVVLPVELAGGGVVHIHGVNPTSG